MNAKIIVQLLALTCVVSWHALAMSVPSGGCYECEEEVWEEVPCDQVPSNATMEQTTLTPPLSTTSTTTTTPKPSYPMDDAMEDPYKKCYCECKVGCKEFCRKVSVHPEIKKQILQVSKITEPLSQGRLESTHYHQRELIPKKFYLSRNNPMYPETKLHHEMPSHAYSSPDNLVNDDGTYAKTDIYNNLIHKTYHNHPAPPTIYDMPNHHYDHSYTKHSKAHEDHYDNDIKLSVATSSGGHGHAESYASPSSMKSSGMGVGHHGESYSPPSSMKSSSMGYDSSVGHRREAYSSPSSMKSSGKGYDSSGGHRGESYSSPSSMKSSSMAYDSVESYIKDIMRGSPSSNYQSYDGYGGHQYSMAFR